MAAVPTLDPHSEPQALVQGEIPDPANPPAGCRFSSRCPLASERCRREPPALREVARAIGSPVIGSHPERGQWGYLFLNNRPIVRGSARIYYPPRLVRRAINEAEHLCTLLPNGFGHFFSTPGSDPPGKIFSGARSPVCQNAAMELLVRVPLPFSRR